MPRRRLGLILGAVGLTLVFGSGLLLVVTRANLSGVLLLAMTVGLGLLVVAFIAVPRTR